MQVFIILIIIKILFIMFQSISSIHILPSHHTHLTTHSHSLGGKVDSLSSLASTANAGPITQGEKRRDSSL